MKPGFVLDIGCGVGRNLRHLNGNGVGIDHNADCVAACCEAGFTAYTADAFLTSDDAVPDRFDSLLFSHVLEHMTEAEAADLVTSYLGFIRPGGRVIVITPQERGQASDATHVVRVDPAAVRRIAVRSGLAVESIGSFPFPRFVGKAFTHNETVSVLRKPAAG